MCLKVLRVFASTLDQNKIFKVVQVTYPLQNLLIFLQECCQEAVIWKQLKHNHILPFIGVNTELFSPSFCLISPWMSNGNVIDYLRQLEKVKHSNVSQLALDAVRFSHPVVSLWIDISIQIGSIASGMQYLHNFDPPIVHGDIRGVTLGIVLAYHV